jgi:hypothetical protein
MGSYSIAVDSQSAQTIGNGNRAMFAVQQLLFLTAGLSEGEHQLTITNLEEGKGLALDSFSVWGSEVACFGYDLCAFQTVTRFSFA